MSSDGQQRSALVEQRRVLIVDDEEALAWSLSTRLEKARPRCSVDMAHDGATALEKLHDGRVDLLVADVRMPGMSGIDLVLAALRLHGALPVIVMTAFQTHEVRRLAESTSGIQFLEKPFEFDRFLGLVDRSLDGESTGFSGAISVKTLPDIVQLYVLSSATGVLTVRHQDDIGRLWFEYGTIAHATTAGRAGEEAFFEIMLWSGGQFSMQLGVMPPERSVTANWQELLMESCRRVDERDRGREISGRTSMHGWTLTPPPLDDPFQDFHVGEPIPARFDCTDEESTHQHVSKEMPMNIKDSLTKLNTIDGFVGAALVDSESGMLLGQEGGGPVNLEIAAAGNTEVVRAKRKVMSSLNLKDAIEDMLITLSRQYHLIRPLRGRPALFFYVVLDRQRANLAMARIGLADVEKDLQV